MRVVVFGSGSPASVIALDAIARCAPVVAVVVPRKGGEALRRRNVPVLDFDPRAQDDLAGRLAGHADLLCVATFPSILRKAILDVAPAINIHWSLLPRHRGPDPLFWTYLNDDRSAGVTLHWLDEGVDTGPILLQREVPLARGRSVLDLYNELASIAGELFREAIPMIAAGSAPRIAQEERLATREPARDLTKIDVANWPAERVWHVLSGLSSGAPLLPAPHGRPRGYEVAQVGGRAGAIERTPPGLRVFCRDGYVDLDPAPRPSWLGRALGRLRR